LQFRSRGLSIESISCKDTRKLPVSQKRVSCRLELKFVTRFQQDSELRIRIASFLQKRVRPRADPSPAREGNTWCVIICELKHKAEGWRLIVQYREPIVRLTSSIFRHNGHVTEQVYCPYHCPLIHLDALPSFVPVVSIVFQESQA